MTPHDATLKAMDEVSGPVVAIALILAAFDPDDVHSGYYREAIPTFAVTIAVSVVLSAFNALTLSPALSAMLFDLRKRPEVPWGPSSAGSIASSGGHRRLCEHV